MTTERPAPFSRPVPLHRVTPEGLTVEIEAGAEERAALARDLGLPAIHALSGRFRLTGSADRVRVAGRISASVDQVCVVSLDPFTTPMEEDVAVDFAAPLRGRSPGQASTADIALDEDDPPEELVGDRIDLGTISAEFLALGLDPYPRKPGIAFEPAPEETPSSPFEGLAALRPREEPE